MREILGIKGYTITETAELLQVTTRTIQTYLKDGILQGRKIGGKWYITEDNIKAFVECK